MVDPLVDQIEEDFKDVMKTQEIGVRLLDVADDLEKSCAGHRPFTRTVMAEIESKTKSEMTPAIREKVGVRIATVLFEPECHPNCPTIAIYRSGFLYLACGVCCGTVGHFKIGD